MQFYEITGEINKMMILCYKKWQTLELVYTAKSDI